MALDVTIPKRNYQTGQSEIAPTVVPLGSTQLQITLDVTDWTNPASILSMAMEKSEDDGVTWTGGGAFTSQPNANGQFIGKNGNVLTNLKTSFSWPSTVTRIRGAITISGATIRTGGTVTVI